MVTVKRRVASKGFTLIELLLVMAILAVLAAVVVPKFVARGEQAKITKAQTDLVAFRDALEAFKLDNGDYPTSNQGLDALVENTGQWPKWQKLLDEVKKDPWDHDYIYRCPGNVNTDSYDLVSMGHDGQEGTDDDITNYPAAK